MFVEFSAVSVTILTHAGTALCGGMSLRQRYASSLMRTRCSMPLQVCCCCCVFKNISHYSGIQNSVGFALPILLVWLRPSVHLFNIACDISNLGKVLVTGQSIFLQFCYVGNGNVCPTVKWVHRNSSTQNHRLKVLACMCQISQDYINWKTRKAVLWKYIQLPEHKTIKNKDRLCILRLYFLTLTLGDEEKWWNKTF